MAGSGTTTTMATATTSTMAVASKGAGAGRGTGIPPAPAAGRGKPQFQEEYDFEQANEQCDEIRLNLAKVAISGGGSEQAASEEKEAGEGEAVEGEEAEAPKEAHTACYNKQKSFFDTISSDSADRENRGKRINWQEEREKDKETFGAMANRRGYYRG